MIAGSESLDFGNTLLEAPDINIARVPQNGRTFEAYGEDPFLVGRLSVANILGIQSQGIIANVKHYAANNQEDLRTSVQRGDRRADFARNLLARLRGVGEGGRLRLGHGRVQQGERSLLLRERRAAQPDIEEGMEFRRLRDLRLWRGA